MEWKPISSAPKDGTHILIYKADEDLVVQAEWVERRNGWQYMSIFSKVVKSVAITHWMPLPKRPEHVSWW